MLNYKTLLFLLILLWMVEPQRGGGGRSRSSSSSRSSSRRSSSSSYYRGSSRRYRSRSSSVAFGDTWLGQWLGFAPTNATATATADNSTVDPDAQDDEEHTQGSGGSGGLTVLGVVGSIIGGLGYLGYKQQKRKSQQRAEKLQKLFTQFQGNCESVPCTLSDQKMIQSKDWFMSRNWSIYFTTNDGSFRQTANLKIKDIKNYQKFSYKIKMSMLDSIGSSQIQGMLVHQADYMSIIFSKTYNNRSQAGQTGLYDLLIYEGVQQGQVFRGRWYYKGFQNSPCYSGTWQMTHKW